jgi:hypothetical protein
MKMDDKKSDVFGSSKLFDYKAMETRLYGELLKTCRRYNNKLSIISIVGILELISQEMKDLNKTDSRDIGEEITHNRDSLDRLV